MRAVTRKSTFVGRQVRVGLCLTLGLAGFAALAPAQGAGAVSGPVTLFDSSTTGTGFFASAATVPASVCFVTITADGGHGGNIVDESSPVVGGVAARVTARVGVTPGDVLAAEVAGAGGSVEPNARSGSVAGGPGGVGGGGGGGEVNGVGAGGGGASAVSASSTGALVVAGGGGGAADNHAGGAGGLPDGGNGSGFLPGLGGLASGVGGAGAPAAGGINAQGGGGGVSTGGFAGSLPSGGNGTGVDAVPSVGGGGGGGVPNAVASAPGGNGGSSDTGQGGTATSAFGGPGGAGNTNGGNGGLGAGSGSGSGGGGGIGFGGGGGGSATGGGGGFGGGGGGANNSGGGGGSSHVISTATSSAYAASTRTGDGQVTITYDPGTDMCAPTPIIVTVSGSQAYGNTPNAFTRTDNAPVGVLSGTVSCTTVNGTSISPTLPVGLYRIDGASCSGLSATGNYQVTYTGGDYAVSKAGQGIHFPKPADLLYGTKTAALNATVTSNLTVVFTSSTTGVCTVSGSTLTVVKAGTCTITASQPGDANHEPASSPITQSFAVGGFMGNGVIEAPEQCDDGNTFDGDGCSATGVITPTQQAQTITFGALANKLYGTTPFTVSASATSGLPVSFSSLTASVCTVSGATVTIKTAGACTIRAAQAGNGSWFAAAPVDRSFTVGYGIASLFPPGSTKFDRGAPIPVVFALTGANGKQIPSAVASTLGCTVNVTFNGTATCATWVPIVNVFGAIIKTPKTLTKGQSYPIVVTVTVGATTVATATTTVIAK